MSDPSKPERPALNVISGDWVSSERWVDFPQTIKARSPFDVDRICEFRVSRSDVFKAADSRRRQPAYQYWSVLEGKPPPVPTDAVDASDGLVNLLDAHACFQGIKRPAGEDDGGEEFVVYVLKPRSFFAYEFRSPIVFSTKEAVPPDLVFLAFVRMDQPSEPGTIKGVLTHWDFVDADERDEMLPVEYDTRFRAPLWRR
jgi:hypothetical protein